MAGANAPTTVYADAASVTTGTKIIMTDNRYSPARFTVPVGTTVAWLNNGVNLHTITAFDGSFESGSMPAGKAWTYTFKKPGTYAFFCQQHIMSGMTGVVEVQ